MLITLLPDLLLLLGGGCLKRTLPPAGWQGIDRLNFYLLFPALIFISALASPPTGSDLLIMGSGVWGLMGLACGLAWLVRCWGPEKFVDFAGMWQTAWRFNTAFAMVVVQALPAEYRGLMSIAIGLAVPVANILAVLALTRGQQLSVWRTVQQVLTNPFLLASVAGIGCAILGWRMPEPVMIALEKLAVAAVPLALLSIGAAINWRALLTLSRFEVALHSIKLLILPLTMLLIGILFTLATGPVIVLMVFAAMPTASAAHVLAAVYGADKEKVAKVIAQSTLLGCLMVPVWLAIISRVFLVAE